MNGFQLDLAKLKLLRGRNYRPKRNASEVPLQSLAAFPTSFPGFYPTLPCGERTWERGWPPFYVSSGSLSLVPVNERTVNMVYFIDSCISRTDLSSLFNATLKDG